METFIYILSPFFEFPFLAPKLNKICQMLSLSMKNSLENQFIAMASFPMSKED